MTLSKVYDYSFKELWLQQPNFTITQSVFIGLFFVACGLVLCATIWYMQLGFIMEKGYPERTKRQRKNGMLGAIKKHSLLNIILLRKLFLDAPEKPPIVHIAFWVNFLNGIIMLTCFIAYICSVITAGAGWSMCLLMFPPITYFTAISLVEFIPSILFLPSERNRYKRK